MAKKLVGIERSGSWFIFIILLLIFFPAAILYWLFRLRKKKIYKIE